MSAYSTKTITREDAERMVRTCRAKKMGGDAVSCLTNEELDSELHDYVYSERHTDVVGCLYHYIIKN